MTGRAGTRDYSCAQFSAFICSAEVRSLSCFLYNLASGSLLRHAVCYYSEIQQTPFCKTRSRGVEDCSLILLFRRTGFKTRSIMTVFVYSKKILTSPKLIVYCVLIKGDCDFHF